MISFVVATYFQHNVGLLAESTMRTQENLMHWQWKIYSTASMIKIAITAFRQNCWYNLPKNWEGYSAGCEEILGQCELYTWYGWAISLCYIRPKLHTKHGLNHPYPTHHYQELYKPPSRLWRKLNFDTYKIFQTKVDIVNHFWTIIIPLPPPSGWVVLT